MNTQKTPKKPPKIRTGSIARRINTAQAWRRFCRSFFLTVLTVALVFLSWCLLIEWAYGGEITNVTNRHFGGSFQWQENLEDMWNQNGIGTELKEYIREHDPFDFKPSTPFDGIEYRFTVTSTVEGHTWTEVPVDTGMHETTEHGYAETETYAPATEPVVQEYYELTGIEIAPVVEETEPVAVEITEEETEPVFVEVTEDETGVPVDVIYDTDAGTVTVPLTDETSETGAEYRSQQVLTRETIDVTHDAAGVLTICSLLFAICLLFELTTLLTSLLGGSRIIKKYLKPIDEIALIADRLSTEVRSTTTEQARQQSAVDLDSLEDAINAIEDSDTRLTVKDSELGALEAALNNMLKRLDEGKRKQIRFVDDASHELRTPIAVIQGYVQLLDRWGKEDPKVRDEAIEAIKTEAEHMKTLIDQLLFLSRGEMDRHVLDKVPVNVSEILEEIRDESIMLDENAPVHHEFTLSLPMKENAEEDEFPYADLMINADIAMMKQAIRILRDNAVKYTPEGGRITFKAYERAVTSTDGYNRQSVCIEISDTGIGIKPKELPRIFDRFYRGENVRSNSSTGSGLGLSIAKWIIDEHGGIMEAISSEGFGTKMTIVMDEAGIVNVSRET